METFTRAQTEMPGTLPTGRWGGRDPFCAGLSDHQPAISPELWRVWEARTRLRGKAHARRIAVAVSAALMVLWLAGVIANFRLGGSIHILLVILLLVAVAPIVIHVLWDRRSIL
jgi:Flp pilus assembly protein TadB